ncbi:MAG: glycoside hydrolase 43 family protein [Ferruginibacter sp.]
MNNKTAILLVWLCCAAVSTAAQQQYAAGVWMPDNGDGTYRNPVIHADYSDPDAIRVGNDFYMTASSFNAIPGLPILHSGDLVNWQLIGHALPQLVPAAHFSVPRYGEGVWAPAIRYHNNEFYIYYPDPDFGIYLIKASSIAGPWSAPVLVEEGKGLIDPCPFWDDNGKAYLVHAFAGSRAGIKSILVIQEMNTGGTQTTGDDVLVYDGHQLDPTVEGPKLYKRHGYYYIFAPAGGVSTGWQLALRAKNIYGPYERRVVMDKGNSDINGPHQGAWVQTANGEDWFLHFQDKGAFGRVVHLQPMHWMNDWPVIGEDTDGDGTGEPVLRYKKPATGKIDPATAPAASDEFNSTRMGLQWQWPANKKAGWYFLTGSALRLNAVTRTDSSANLWTTPNLLLQKFPADSFTATVKCSFKPRATGEQTGLLLTGMDYAGISLIHKADGIYLQYIHCSGADKGTPEQNEEIVKLNGGNCYLRVQVSKTARCRFSYSLDGNRFENLPGDFTAKPGKWMGAKLGLYCMGTIKTNDNGWSEFDWFRFSK